PTRPRIARSRFATRLREQATPIFLAIECRSIGYRSSATIPSCVGTIRHAPFELDAITRVGQQRDCCNTGALGAPALIRPPGTFSRAKMRGRRGKIGPLVFNLAPMRVRGARSLGESWPEES